ncbi:MAG: hypothetical protein O7A65_09895 [Proteobacteria bacterium]|nr:hypothetical protein [Pseudomonadota bacterium]
MQVLEKGGDRNWAGIVAAEDEGNRAGLDDVRDALLRAVEGPARVARDDLHVAAVGQIERVEQVDLKLAVMADVAIRRAADRARAHRGAGAAGVRVLPGESQHRRLDLLRDELLGHGRNDVGLEEGRDSRNQMGRKVVLSLPFPVNQIAVMGHFG